MRPFLFTLIILLLTFSACKKDEGSPENPTAPANENEIITTVKLVLTDSNGAQTTATWKDLDGIGPDQPVVTNLNLKPNQQYSGKVLLLDETKIPADTISNEVAEEAEAHQFFYTLSGSAANQTIITRSDVDVNQLPLGLTFSLHTSDTANGNLKVVLKHYDGIPKSTDPTIGETDVMVTFPLLIAP